MEKQIIELRTSIAKAIDKFHEETGGFVDVKAKSVTQGGYDNSTIDRK